MSKVSMKTICEILDLDLYEIFAVRGRTHGGGTKKGDEFLFFFSTTNLHAALWPKDINQAIATGYICHCPISPETLHAIFSGMLKVVRAKPENRRYIRGHEPGATDVIKTFQTSLF